MSGKIGKSPVAWAIAGAVVSLLVAAALFDPYLFTGGDNAGYYALAKALAEGRGYVDIVHPDVPPQTVYPPGFPALLVPFYWIFGGSMIGLKIASLVAAGILLRATWGLARRDRAVPTWAAAAAVWLVGLYPVFLEYTKWVLSDMSYTAAAVVALWAFARPEASGREGETRADRIDARWVVACLLAVGAFYIRTAGVTLLAAAAVAPALHGWWRRSGAAAGIAALGTLPWFLWSRQGPPGTGGYLEQLTSANRLDPESPRIGAAELAERTLDTIGHYATVEFPRLFWPSDPLPTPVVAFGVAIGGSLLVWGAVRAIHSRGVAVHDLYALFSLALLAIWPWTGDRFFLTVAPVLWLLLLVGLDDLSRLASGSPVPARVAGGLLAVALLVGAAARIPNQWERTRGWLDGEELAGYEPFWQDYFQASRWVGENAPDAVIAARKPRLAWYWSRRPSLVYPFHGDPGRTWEFLRENEVTHIVLEPTTRAYLRETLMAHVDELGVVHAAPHRIAFVVRLGLPRER